MPTEVCGLSVKARSLRRDEKGASKRKETASYAASATVGI